MWRIVRGHELRDACDRASSGLSGTKTYSKHATKHKLKQSDPRDTTARHTWRPLRRVMSINNPYFYITLQNGPPWINPLRGWIDPLGGLIQVAGRWIQSLESELE